MSEASLEAWNLALSAMRWATPLEKENVRATFALDDRFRLRQVDEGDADALITWVPSHGWQALLAPADPRRGLLDLYLPVSGATPAHPVTVGHLGQSLDGFIATHTGDSQFVTGHENIVHLHRMRALSNAVVVGAGTVAADNPQLTTRHVNGPNPLRVVFDPRRRLGPDYRIFQDESPATLYACAASLIEPGETHIGHATIVPLRLSAARDDLGRAGVMSPQSESRSADVAELMRVLRERNCYRIFVEGGGVTVSAFLEANMLDRLHVAVAPLLIGDGRPAIRLAGRPVLRDCRRPGYRVFRMGGDVLFDCDLRRSEDADTQDDALDGEPLTRVI